MAEPEAEAEVYSPPSVILDQKQIMELQKVGPKVLVQAQDFPIETLEDYEASTRMLNLIAERSQKVTQFFEEPAKQANAVHKWITGLRSTLLTPFQQAETLIKNRRREWREEEERKRRLKEEEERKKAKEEADARALEEAKQLVDIGEHQAAETVIERQATAPAPPVFVPSTIPKQAGHTLRKIWRYRVKNPDLHKREFMMLDDSKVAPIVKNLGRDAESLVGGIEVYPEEIETSRRR